MLMARGGTADFSNMQALGGKDHEMRVQASDAPTLLQAQSPDPTQAMNQGARRPMKVPEVSPPPRRAEKSGFLSGLFGC